MGEVGWGMGVIENTKLSLALLLLLLGEGAGRGSFFSPFLVCVGLLFFFFFFGGRGFNSR